jgi:SHAQKYF class myb-like DNA-binding protein
MACCTSDSAACILGPLSHDTTSDRFIMSTPTTPQQNGSKSFLFVSCSNPDLNESKREQDLDQLESTRKSVTSSQMHDTELTTEQIENVLDGVQLPTNLVFIPKETHRSRSTIVDKVPSSIKRSFIDQGEESYISSTKKMKEDHSFSSTSQLSIPLCHPSFTAPTSADSMGSSFNAKKGKCVSFGRWTKEEHQAFLQGLKVYGREWKKVAQNIPTRSSAQIRSHAQKYFAKMAKDEQLRQEEAQQCHDSKLAQDPTSSALVQREANADPSFDIRHLTPSVLLGVDRILEDPHGAQIEVEDTLRLLKERYLELQKKLYEHQLKKNDEEHQISASAFDLYSSISKSSDRSPFLSQSSPIRISAESIALHKKELIALDVLGGELYRSGSKENLVSATQENTILKNAPQQHSDTQSNGSA